MTGVRSMVIVERTSLKGGERLKRLCSILLMMTIALALAACAPKSGDTLRAKCPACGYEFVALSGN